MLPKDKSFLFSPNFQYLYIKIKLAMYLWLSPLTGVIHMYLKYMIVGFLKYTNRRFLYQIGRWIVLYSNYFHKTWVICSFLKAKQSTCLSFKHITIALTISFTITRRLCARKEWLAKRNKATLISLCSLGRATSADIGREFQVTLVGNWLWLKVVGLGYGR
jgi:hypothetical protein